MKPLMYGEPIPPLPLPSNDFLLTQQHHMIFRCDLSQPKDEANPSSVWEWSQTYNAVLCTLSGADLLLWKLLPAALLSVCGLWFSEITSRSSLTRDLSSPMGLSCCFFDFSNQRRTETMSTYCCSDVNIINRETRESHNPFRRISSL